MSMTNNDEIALKEDWRDDYEKIFPIPEGMERTASYGDGISTGYINKSCFITLATVYLHRWAGYKVGREALLAEREADKALIAEQEKRIAELEQRHCGGALMEREQHHVGVVNKLLEHIAELEARTLTVKFPEDWHFEECETEGCQNGALFSVGKAAKNLHLCEVCAKEPANSRLSKTALPKRLPFRIAAGITLVVGE